jgi:hypothetical protein
MSRFTAGPVRADASVIPVPAQTGAKRGEEHR